jgi:hypothetical protein
MLKKYFLSLFTGQLHISKGQFIILFWGGRLYPHIHMKTRMTTFIKTKFKKSDDLKKI